MLAVVSMRRREAEAIAEPVRPALRSRLRDISLGPLAHSRLRRRDDPLVDGGDVLVAFTDIVGLLAVGGIPIADERLQAVFYKDRKSVV